MRAMMWAGTLLGALVMSAGTAQEKKDEKKEMPDPGKKESYKDKVTVREWAGDKFGPPIKDVPAFYWEQKDGKLAIWIWTAGTTAKAPKGSEITDQKTGDVWVVTSATKGQANWLCYGTKKPAEKKSK